MGHLEDLSGQRFGRLVAQYPVHDGTRWRWHCQCDCGNTKDVTPPDLKRGMVKSCGCYRRDFRKHDLAGQRFGRLTVLGVAEDDMKHHGQRWLCQCDCGNTVIVRSDGLVSGHTKGCGCENARRTTHGKADTKLFKVWTGMKQRCFNPKDYAYPNYGGRGVTICAEWSNDFSTFYEWSVTHGYKEGLSIDRIDVNGNYCPENCRWATPLQQMRNRRNTVYLEFEGSRHSLTEWSEITGIKRDTLDGRYRKGWPTERVLFEPVNAKYRNGRCKNGIV